MSAALHRVEHDLRVVVAAAEVEVNDRGQRLAALLGAVQRFVRNFIGRAAIVSGPVRDRVLDGHGQHELPLQGARPGHDHVRRAVHEQDRRRRGSRAPLVQAGIEPGADHGEGRVLVGHLARQPLRHEAAVREPGDVHARAVDGEVVRQRVHQRRQKRDVVRLRPDPFGRALGIIPFPVDAVGIHGNKVVVTRDGVQVELCGEARAAATASVQPHDQRPRLRPVIGGRHVERIRALDAVHGQAVVRLLRAGRQDRTEEEGQYQEGKASQSPHRAPRRGRSAPVYAVPDVIRLYAAGAQKSCRSDGIRNAAANRARSSGARPCRC